MNRRRLLRRNLRFHWRGNLALLLGVAVGTAVLTGALLVGDSLRGSLRDLARQRLGWVDQALVGTRFFRQELAGELPASRVAPALVLRGSASTGTDGRRVGNVLVYGVDERFWDMGTSAFSDGAILNRTLAAQLGVEAGSPLTLHVGRTSDVPRESLLAHRDAAHVLGDLRLKVAAVLPTAAADFSLNPSPAAPRNVFVPLAWLQKELEQPGRVNALLVGGAGPDLAAKFRQQLTLADWGLLLRTPGSRAVELFAKLDRNKDGRLTRTEYRDQVAEVVDRDADADGDGVLTRAEVENYYRQRHGHVTLESKRMLLEPVVADAALQTAAEMALTPAPTLVYLANSITAGDQSIPYSVVAAVVPTLPPPLGPFLPEGVDQLDDDAIVLADWKESPLAVQPGDSVTLTYFAPEEQGRLEEKSAVFRLKGLVPLMGVAADPDLTPEFPGITDKLTLDKWDPPFPYDNKRVKPRDDDYWKQYRTTPKAYITLAAGQRLWRSRFGELTSIRLAPASGEAPQQGADAPRSPDLEKIAAEFTRRLLDRLSPEQAGLVFDPVRDNALSASTGGMDFGGLFLGFSFFLIAAALLLVGLLFRLNIDRRAEEIGLLLATGYRQRTVRRLLLVEGGLVAAAGALLGLFGAAVYCWLLLGQLAAWWPGGLEASFLRLHVTGWSLATGYFASLVTSLLTIVWAVRILGRAAPSALLAGQSAGGDDFSQPLASRRRFWLPLAATGLGVLLLARGPFVHDHEMRAMVFFGGGALLLTAALAAIGLRLAAIRQRPQAVSRQPLADLGVRNAARQPTRSLLTAGLLASAVFLVVAVEAFRRQPDANYAEKESGSGGFALLAELDLPLYQDLNTEDGRFELNFPDDSAATLQGVQFFGMRRRAGDDASCLNLFQPRRPQVLGVPPGLIQRQGFVFADTEARTDEEKANPWLLLNQTRADGAVPVFGEKNTVQWMLKAGLGSELTIPDESGQPVKVRIVGLLKDSIFQSGLLMSEAAFLRLYPQQEGYAVYLVEAPADRVAAVADLLRKVLARRGVEVTPSAERLALYLAVENTYLSTFQALGGLGLVLGALGLAVVLLRNAWERRGELALLRALGYRQSALGRLVLAENVFLLALGLGAGSLAALLAVAPSVVTGEAQVPWLRLAGLLVLVTVVGLGAGAAAVRMTVRAPLLPALRRE